MEIIKTTTDNKEILKVSGRLDATSALLLDKELKGVMDNGKFHLTLDLAALQYLSSAGLRVILATHKRCVKGDGKLEITNASKTLVDIFDVTGMSAILNIE